MPRKKAEPEVLQEELLQSENPNPEMPIEELPAEQPVLEQRTEEVLAEEPADEAPVQPYGEEEVAKEEAPAEAAEPEKKSFYELDFRALDQDLSPEQRQEWNTIYASFRSRSVMRGTIIGVDPHTMTVRSAQTGQTETKRMYCAVIVPFRARILIPETEMWAENEERPAFVLRNMPGAQIDFVITHVDCEAGFAMARVVWRWHPGVISSPHSRFISRAAVFRAMCWPSARVGASSNATATMSTSRSAI